jgi:hypothetical protein
MRDLRQEVEQLRKQTCEFEEALRLLENPPERYGPRSGENGPLDFLKAELSVLEGEQERNRLLAMARQSLANAKEMLTGKEQELEALENDCQAIADEMDAAGQQVLAHQNAYRQALENFRQLALKHYPRWHQLNAGSELYQQLGAVDFPVFKVRGCCGILTSGLIARDLR